MQLRKLPKLVGILALCGLLLPVRVVSQDVAPSSGRAAAQVATATHGMVASQEREASTIGVDILKRGGNAVDAAVAVGFALAVTLPKAGNIGGGGFMIVHLADRNQNIAIDYRETAPAATTPDIFLGPDGEADPAKSRDSGLGVGVPGTVAGLTLALERYGSGKFTLADLIAPAVRLARKGVPVRGDLLDSLRSAQERLAHWPSSARIFLKPDGSVPAEGDVLVQPQLADVLEAIGREGPRAFYIGPVADKIVTAVRAAGGVMTRIDLQRYSPLIRTPVRGTYRGYDIVSMPPPSSGGVHLVEMLNILEGYESRTVVDGSPESLRHQIEAMKRAYRDRARFLGDIADVPLARLTSKAYAATLRQAIDARQQDVRELEGVAPEGRNTTHFSIVDEAGNSVANTYTLNFNYGVAMVAGGTGIVLNNELDDFAAKPGARNAYGLTGGAANAPGSGKRPLSSMTPTIVFRDGKPFILTGSPGGSRIITTVLQVILNRIDGGMTIGDAVAAPRLHHQAVPDEVVVERDVPPEKVQALEALGYTVRADGLFGSAHSIEIGPGGITGAADMRARGAAAVGY